MGAEGGVEVRHFKRRRTRAQEKEEAHTRIQKALHFKSGEKKTRENARQPKQITKTQEKRRESGQQ